jgi:EmrB/QacA subfamily drug resistance transporter
MIGSRTEGPDLRRPTLLVSVLASFLTPFMASSVNIALPTIGREFGTDAVVLGWVATAYLLAATAFLLPFGRLGDLHGRRRIFLSGTLAYTAASLLCGLAPSIAWLIGLRALQGAAAAMIFATGVAMITSVFPPGERGRALGITVAAVYLGLALGPTLGGVLTQQLSWRSLFLANVPLGLTIAAVLTWRLRADWAEARGESFDRVGTVVLAAALTLLMLGTPQIGRGGLWLLGAGGVLLLAFVWWERRVPHPLIDVTLFLTSRVFAYSNLAALINYAATFAVTFLLSLYLQVVKALSPQAAGLVLVAQPLVMAACSPFAGRLSDRIEPRTVASAGMGVIALALGLLTSLGEATPLVAIVGMLAVLGVGFGFFASPNTNAVMGSVERRNYGVASATLATMRLAGQTLSMGVATLIFAVAVGRVPIFSIPPQAFMQSLRAAFLVFSALCVLGVLASLARGAVPRGESAAPRTTEGA